MSVTLRVLYPVSSRLGMLWLRRVLFGAWLERQLSKTSS